MARQGTHVGGIQFFDRICLSQLLNRVRYQYAEGVDGLSRASSNPAQRAGLQPKTVVIRALTIAA